MMKGKHGCERQERPKLPIEEVDEEGRNKYVSL